MVFNSKESTGQRAENRMGQKGGGKGQQRACKRKTKIKG